MTKDPHGTCRECGKEVFWITTRKGKHVPCDPELIPVYAGGDELLFAEDGTTIKGTTKQAEGFKLIGHGHRSHWSTCKKAGVYKKGSEPILIPKPQLHELDEKRRAMAEEVKGAAWDSPTRSHHKAKAEGMDKALAILGYEWRDNRYQRMTASDSHSQDH